MLARRHGLVVVLALVSAGVATAADPRFGLPQALNTTADVDFPAIMGQEAGQEDAFPRLAVGGAAPDLAHECPPRQAATLVAVWDTGLDTRDGRRDIPPFAAFGLDRDVLASRSADGGGTWSPPIPVNDAHGDNDQVPEADDTRPSIATDGDCLWVAVWGSRVASVGGKAKGTDPDILVAASHDDGASWGTVRALTPAYATGDGGVAGAGGSEKAPEIVFVPDSSATGAFVTVWYTSDGDATNRVLGARSTGFGSDGAPTWPDCPTLINPHPEPSPASVPGPCGEVFRLENAADPEVFTNAFPHIATDGDGRVLVVWSSDDPALGAGLDDHDIVISRSDDGGATWKAPGLLLPDATSNAGDDLDVRIASDGAHGWAAIWQRDAPGDGSAPETATIVVSVSGDDGDTWNEPVVLNPGTLEDLETLHPQIARSGDGEWLAVWETSAFACAGDACDEDTDIVLATSPDGTTWTAPRPLAPNAERDLGRDSRAQLAVDGTAVVAVWQSTDTLLSALGPAKNVGNDDDILFARAPDCSNGVLDVDVGETCDDTNRDDEDCCSSTCGAAGDGDPCRGDGRPCSESRCIAGACVSTPKAPETTCDSDCRTGGKCDGLSFDCPGGEPDAGRVEQLCEDGTFCMPKRCNAMGNCTTRSPPCEPCMPERKDRECPNCGNGELDAGEGCDDRNNIADDGCTRCTPDCDERRTCPTLRSCFTQKCQVKEGNPALGSRCVMAGKTCDEDCDPGDECDDGNDCTIDACNGDNVGCVHPDRGGFDFFTCPFKGKCPERAVSRKKPDKEPDPEERELLRDCESDKTPGNSLRRTLKRVLKMDRDAREWACMAPNACPGDARGARRLLRRARRRLEGAILEVVVLNFAGRITTKCAGSLSDRLNDRARQFRGHLGKDKGTDMDKVTQACASPSPGK